MFIAVRERHYLYYILYILCVGLYDMSADGIGLAGIKKLCDFLNDSLLEFIICDTDTKVDWKLFYENCIGLIIDYLDKPGDASVCERIFNHINTAPKPISEENGLCLLDAIKNADQRDIIANDTNTDDFYDDVSLEIPENVDPILFDSFLQEASQNVVELNAITQRIGYGKYSDQDIDLARRLAHTLKGSASIIGIRGITRLAHYIEDIFQLLDDNLQHLHPSLYNVLSDATECLAQMVDFLLGQEDPPLNAHSIVREISLWTQRLGERDGLSSNERMSSEFSPDIVDSELLLESTIYPTVYSPQFSEKDGSDLSRAARNSTFRVSSQLVNELFRLLNEMSMKIGYLGERLEETVQKSRSLMSQNARVLARVNEIESAVGLRGFSTAPVSSSSPNDMEYDPLEMDRYSEVYCLTRSLLEEVTDAREIGASIDENINSLSSLVVQQELANKDLQYNLLAIRMASVQSIVPRLLRNVKQTCKATGKQADFNIAGSEIEIDSELLNKLADPLLHILRNAVDHGIESSEERRSKGKLPVGKIELTFERYGQSILARCQDDGKGLDYAGIRMKALQRGLISPDQDLNHSELARLILLPGFSTREHITEVSGRGIGMDVVRDCILSMKGTIDIKSERGIGCQVELRLPVSLVMIQALLVRDDGNLYAMPNYNLEQVIGHGMANFVSIGNEINLMFEKVAYPCRSLKDLLGIAHAPLTIQDMMAKYVLLVHGDDEIIAVVVDEVRDNRDLLVRGLGSYVKNVKGILGLSILGNGAVVPVLDMPELLRTPIPIRIQLSATEPVLQVLPKPPSAKSVLVVDDSLTVRKSLARLIENAGYAVRSAKDGVEAVDMIQKHQPDLLLTDLEMPNMNGLGLTSFVRSYESTKAIPVIMITSRAMNKHRQQAMHAGVDIFLTKPYLEKELLGYIHNSFEKMNPAASFVS
jgi:chemosensory pili system protein ChpA (sensor histidine kinase/response regulator)